MAGQAACCSRDELRSKIKSVEMNKNTAGSSAPKMSLKVRPLSVLRCHCTVGVGTPVAEAVNVAT